ncbi:MAG: hypothetical protein ACI9H8_000862 [Lysobacterales bacterium]|jgi:hypothetical protein
MAKRKFFNLIMLIAMIAGIESAISDDSDQLLFESLSVLELTMPVNFDSLCRPSESPDCEYAETVFEYTGAAGAKTSVPISIRRRDGWRATKTNCQVPTLFVRFEEKDTVGTPFEGQSSLALTSHCGKGISPQVTQSRRLPDAFESYVVNEYIGYRLYNLIADASLRVRLVRINYTNPENPRRDFKRYAFFAEHFDSLAKRLNARLLPAGSFDLSSLDLAIADQLALFQYMVGNTDWSIQNQDNVLLLEMQNGNHVPVLFDLDMSGLVNAYYASPAPDLPIRSVKQRYYQGNCHPETDWTGLFNRFNAMRADMMGVLAETPGLRSGDRRMSSVYLDSFFNTLGLEESRESEIINACLPWPL